MSNNEAERVVKINTKIAQLKAQKLALLNRQKEKERKERTRRLIQNGAIAEQYLQCKNIPPTDFEMLLSKIVELGEVKQIINQNNPK